MRKRVISTLLAMATTAGLFAGNVSAVYAEGKSSGDYEYQELEDAEITYYNYSVEGKELYEKEIAAYNEVHPNVKINLELVGGRIAQQLPVHVLFNNAVNVVVVGTEHVREQ